MIGVGHDVVGKILRGLDNAGKDVTLADLENLADRQPLVEEFAQFLVSLRDRTFPFRPKRLKLAYSHKFNNIAIGNIVEMHLLRGRDEVVMRTSNGRILQCRIEPGKLEVIRDHGFETLPTVIATAPSGRYFAVGFSDGKVFLFNSGLDTPCGRKPSVVVKLHHDSVSALAISAKEFLISAGGERSEKISIISVSSLDREFENNRKQYLSQGDFGKINALAINPATDEILVATSKGCFVFPHPESMYIENYRILPTKKIIGEDEGNNFTSIAVSPDGSLLVAGSNHGIGTYLFRLENNDEAVASHARLDVEHSFVDQLAFTPDGKFLVYINVVSDSIIIWDATKPGEIERLLERPKCSSFAISEKGDRLILAGSGEVFVFCDAPRRKKSSRSERAKSSD